MSVPWTSTIDANGTDAKTRAQLAALTASLKGTIPGSRGFGLAGTFLDRPPNEAANIFAVELEEAAREFLPAVSVSSVETTAEISGRLVFQIAVEARQ